MPGGGAFSAGGIFRCDTGPNAQGVNLWAGKERQFVINYDTFTGRVIICKEIKNPPVHIIITFFISGEYQSLFTSKQWLGSAYLGELIFTVTPALMSG